MEDKLATKSFEDFAVFECILWPIFFFYEYLVFVLKFLIINFKKFEIFIQDIKKIIKIILIVLIF